MTTANLTRRRHLLSRLRLAGVAFGAALIAEVVLLSFDVGHFDQLQVVFLVFCVAFLIALIVRHRARFGLKTFLILAPAVAILGVLASNVVRELHRQRTTANQISKIGGSYYAGRIWRRYGLVDLGDYYLPESVVDLIGEEAFLQIRGLRIPVQSLKGTAVSGWKLEGITRVTLINKNDGDWPVDQLRTLLSAPDLQRVDLSVPVSEGQSEALVKSLRDRPIDLNLQYNGNLAGVPDQAQLSALRVLEKLSGPEVFLDVSGGKLSPEEIIAVANIPNIQWAHFYQVDLPPDAASKLRGVNNVLISGSNVSVASLPPLLASPILSLHGCTIVSSQSSSTLSQIAHSSGGTQHLDLNSVTCPPEILRQLVSVPSLKSVRIASTPVNLEALKELAAHPSVQRVTLQSVGQSSEQVETIFDSPDVPRGKRPKISVHQR